MKLHTIIATSLLLSSQAFASCYDSYSQKLTEVKAKVAETNANRAAQETAILSSASSSIGLTGVSTITANPFLLVTGVTAVSYSSAKVSEFYIDFRLSDSTKKLLSTQATIQDGLSLLKEAQVGNGPTLQKAMVAVTNEISTSVSLRDLAETIKSQDAQGLYCESEETMLSAQGILKVAMDELALRR